MNETTICFRRRVHLRLATSTAAGATNNISSILPGRAIVGQSSVTCLVLSSAQLPRRVSSGVIGGFAAGNYTYLAAVVLNPWRPGCQCARPVFDSPGLLINGPRLLARVPIGSHKRFKSVHSKSSPGVWALVALDHRELAYL